MRMLHPIFSVLLRRPELLIDHVAGYAALVREEASTTGSELGRRAVAGAVAVLGFIMFLMLAGMAAMIGSLEGRFHWMLLLVPGAALAVSVVGLQQARRKLPHPAFAEVRAQLEADAQALRTLGSEA